MLLHIQQNNALPTEIHTVDATDNIFVTAEEGTDFVGVNQVLDFPANQMIMTVEIQLADGVDVDKQEYFEVCLSNPMFGHVDPPECAIIYIEDNDCKIF